MEKFDNLDKKALGAIIILIIAITIISIKNQTAPNKESAAARQRIILPPSPELSTKTKIATELLNNNNIEKAENLINSLVADFPYYGAPFLLLGDLHLRKQNPLKAMLAYRDAILINPDYLDKKARDFQGKKIKLTVSEAGEQLEKELKKDPTNKDLKKNKEIIYFMMRKIAGSCG